MPDSVTPKQREAASKAIRLALGPPDQNFPQKPFDGAEEYPNIDLAWQLAQKMYPQAASGVDRFSTLGMLDSKTGRQGGVTLGRFGGNGRPDIQVNPELEDSNLSQILDVIGHELVHSRQAQRAPNFTKWLWSDGTDDERQAYAIADAVGGGQRPKMRKDILLP